MTGLLFFALIGLWMWACVAMTKAVTRRMRSRPWRWITAPVLLATLLVLPVVDEIVGRFQFERLCRVNGIDSADLSNAEGKKVNVEYGERSPVGGTALPVQGGEVLYRQVDTGVLLFQHWNYYSNGGWLMRYTPIGMGSSHPMLFSGNGCGFALRDRLLAASRITIVN